MAVQGEPGRPEGEGGAACEREGEEGFAPGLGRSVGGCEGDAFRSTDAVAEDSAAAVDELEQFSVDCDCAAGFSACSRGAQPLTRMGLCIDMGLIMMDMSPSIALCAFLASLFMHTSTHSRILVIAHAF